MASDAVAVAAADTTPTKVDWIKSFADLVNGLSSGERAGLRRWERTQSYAADGTVIKLLFKSEVPESRHVRDFDRWRLIAHVAAILVGTGSPPGHRNAVPGAKVLRAHSERRQLGAAFSDAGLSESRMLRLLALRGEALHNQVRSAVRFLTTEKERRPVNLWTLYHLVGNDSVKAEAARIRIAQDFYAAEARSKKETPSDD